MFRLGSLHLALLCTVLFSFAAEARRLDALRRELDEADSPFDDSTGSMIVLPLDFDKHDREPNEDRRLRALDLYAQTPPESANELARHVEESFGLTANNAKRSDGVRRCGMVLLKHIQKLCNGCVGRPRGEEDAAKTKRNPFTDNDSLTDICCKRSCEDSDLQMFCCD
ncbi:hypothetical protein M3Y99_00333400 [Aphelenchoides fujianensis]|nr:hypothetical protein M3Y99_00333400 [Aphelenchoides fujianensis]